MTGAGVNKTASAQFEEERRTRGTKTMKTWTEDLFVQRDAARTGDILETPQALAERRREERTVKENRVDFRGLVISCTEAKFCKGICV